MKRTPARIPTRIRLLAAALLACVAQGAPAIFFTYDYAYDAAGSNFFAPGSAARTTLETVGDYFAARIGDSLTAIDSNGTDSLVVSFRNPDTGAVNETIGGLDLAAGEILIIPGAHDLGGSTLAQAGPGVFGFGPQSSVAFELNARTRGQGTLADVSGIGSGSDGATEFALWGGTVAVDLDRDWHFGLGAPTGGFDFLSVLFHEFGHILGIGTADSWFSLVNGSNEFTGSAAVADYGGPVPLQAGSEHWDGSVKSTVAGGPEGYIGAEAGAFRRASLAPTFGQNTRRLFTEIDLAALDDLGWDIINPPVVVPLPGAAWLLVSGLSLLVLRRSRARPTPARA